MCTKINYIFCNEYGKINSLFAMNMETVWARSIRGAFYAGSCGVKLNFGRSGMNSGVKNKKGPRRSPFNAFLRLVATRRQAEEVLYLQWAQGAVV
jgi:hypothetical protein